MYKGGKVMKKTILVFLAIGCMVMFPFGVFAGNWDAVPGGSVYASGAEQDEIYGIIQKSELFVNSMKNHGVGIMKESITPIYTADFLEYARTGVFTIIPHVTGHFKEVPENGGGQVYMVKAVTTRGFAGFYIFYVEDGIAYHTSFFPSAQLEPGNTSIVSPYYADHARRVASLTGREAPLPASDVRLVQAGSLGTVFYVNNEGLEALIVIGADGRIFYGDSGEIAYFDDELRGKANELLHEHNDMLKWAEEWKTANPGEEFSHTGGVRVSYYTINSNDIDDIYTEINDVRTVPESPKNEEIENAPPEEGDNPGKGWGIIAVIAIPAALGVFIILKRK
jgi:hypothetical protein